MFGPFASCDCVCALQVVDFGYSTKFRAIVFAIFEDGNSRSAVNPRGNGIPFAEAFNVPLLTVPEYVAGLSRIDTLTK